MRKRLEDIIYKLEQKHPVFIDLEYASICAAYRISVTLGKYRKDCWFNFIELTWMSDEFILFSIESNAILPLYEKYEMAIRGLYCFKEILK